MKTIFSFLFCCFAATIAFAQTAPANYRYIPMVVENAHWTVRTEIRDHFTLLGILYSHQILRGDTLIGGVTYKKLYDCPNMVAGLREDTSTHKVYVYPFNNNYYNYGWNYPTGQDRLLIDFNQDSASQVNVPWLDTTSGLSNTIDVWYQGIGTSTRLRRTLTYRDYCDLRTIEGIGFGNGGPSLRLYCLGLSCEPCRQSYSYVSAYDIVSPTQNCSSFVATESIEQENLVKAFPNPMNGVFYIQNLPPQVTLTLHDALGKSVDFTQKENEINLQNLPNGFYFLNIMPKDGTKQTLKLVKETP